jgi:PAS domain S-box-containing protein
MADMKENLDSARPVQSKSGFLEAICNNSTVALFIMDQRQRCVFMNPAAEKLTGFTFAEVEGRVLHDVIHHTRPDGRPFPRAECPIDRAFPENNQQQGEEVFVHRDGHFYQVAYTASPIRQDNLGVVGTVIEVRDITEEKRREEQLNEQARSLQIINRVGAVLAAELDLTKLVQAATDAGTEVTGAQFGAFFYNARDATGESLTLYTISGAPKEAFSKFPIPRATALFGPTFRGESIVRIGDVLQDQRYGHNAPYHGMPRGHLPVRSYLAVPVISRSGEVLGGLYFGHAEPNVFTASSESIVKAIAAEAAIAIDNSRLYEAVQRHAGQLERTVEERTASLREVVSQMNEFSFTLSHDLRAPLRSILGFSDLLLQSQEEPQNQRRFLEQIRQSAQRMDLLINDVLTLSRVAREELRFEILHPDALCREIIDSDSKFRPPASIIEMESLGAVIGHRTLLSQAFTNLLSNAVKFVAPGTVPRVRLWSEPKGDWVRVWVEDNGIGIPLPLQQKMFNMFERGGATNYEGTGIGLVIVRKAVERMNGSVGFESNGQAGSRFWVQLPKP